MVWTSKMQMEVISHRKLFLQAGLISVSLSSFLYHLFPPGTHLFYNGQVTLVSSQEAYCQAKSEDLQSLMSLCLVCLCPCQRDMRWCHFNKAMVAYNKGLGGGSEAAPCPLSSLCLPFSLRETLPHHQQLPALHPASSRGSETNSFSTLEVCVSVDTAKKPSIHRW